jgi:hypothetical protein
MDPPATFVAQLTSGDPPPVLAVLVAFLRSAGVEVHELGADERGEGLTEATRHEMAMCPISIVHFAGGFPQSQSPRALRIIHNWGGTNPTRTILTLVDRPLSDGGLRERMLHHRALDTGRDSTQSETLALHLARLILPPHYDAADPPQDLHEWLAYGTACNHWGRSEEALSAFKQAAQLHPDDYTVRTNLAYTHLRLSQWEEGIRFGWDVFRSTSLWCAGQCHMALQQYERAQHAYGRALGIWPTYPAALLGQGEIYRHLDQTEQARECFQKAIEVHNIDDAWAYDHPAIARRAWEHLSEIYLAAGDHEHAAEAAARAAQLAE